MSNIFFHITAAAYFIATLVFIAYLVKHNEQLVKAGRYILYCGFAAHTLTLILRFLEAGRVPVANLHESLTLYSWLMVAVYVVLLFKYRMEILGAFVAPFALLLIITASFLPSEIVPLAPLLESYWLPVHVVLAFLGNTFFALACIAGIMYLIQDRYLKKRKIKGLYFILPSLEVLDNLGYKCLTYGFSFLTLAIISGAIWSDYSLGTYWSWGARQDWSLITWILYAALLHGRLTTGWRGRKSAIFSVAAFLILLGSFFVIYIIVGASHGLVKQ